MLSENIKNILVISDNPRLVEYFRIVFKKIKQSKASVKFCYSHNNQNPEKLSQMNMVPINLKDSETIDMVQKNFHLIFSLHCKQIFPSSLVKSCLCINVHPGYNPHNRGWFPQVFSIINGKPAGATIHIMDEYIDRGKIIDQALVNIQSSDTSYDVYERVLSTEKELIRKNLSKIIDGKFSSHLPLEEGNYNSIQDYRALCDLNLEDRSTLREHIDLLRALSHEGFNNAYFRDSSGKKVFVALQMQNEA